MRIGITYRLSAVLAIFAVLASGLTGYYAFTDNRRLLLAHSEKNAQTNVQIIGQQLQDALNSTARDARFLASQANPATAADTPLNTDRILQTAHSLMQIHPEYLHISLIDARRGWRESARIVREGTHSQKLGHSSMHSHLQPVLHLTPGQVFLAEDFTRKPDCENCENQENQAGEPDERRMSFLVSTPIAREGGMNSNILVAIRIDLAFLVRRIGISLPPTSRFYIADNEGNLIYLSQGSNDGANLAGESLQTLFPAARPVIDGNQDVLVYNDIQHQERQEDGRLIAFKRIQPTDFSNGRYFTLVVFEPLSAVFQDIRTLWDNMWLLVLSFSLLAVILALVVSQAITNPLAKILASVQRFTAGEKDSEILLSVKRRSDEIGALAVCVGEMQDQIRNQLVVLEKNHQAMQHMAHHDPLTGLANRLTFYSLGGSVIAQARRQGLKLAILFVDLDHFKEVNDKYGHFVGDQLLLAVAKRLREGVRESDIVARLGGDEFVVMLSPIHNGVEAEMVGKKLLRRFNEPLTIEEGGKTINLAIHASIGISLYPDHGEAPQELVDIADEAMYVSKGSGRNTCTLANLEELASRNTAKDTERKPEENAPA